MCVIAVSRAAANSVQSRFETGSAVGQAEAFEIQELTVLLDAEIEMGAGGEAGHADEADGAALFDVLAGANEDAGEMHVVGGVAVGVLDGDQISGAAFSSCEGDAAFADGLHGGADGGGVINAEVRAIFFEDWMVAACAVMRGDGGGEFQRGVEEGFFHRFAIGREVGGMAGEIMEEDGAIGVAGVVVFGG